MTEKSPLFGRSGRSWQIRLGILMAASVVAIVGAHGFAGSWNDGSRLATVESLVDRHTWVIDRSIFVDVPTADASRGRSPYPADDSNLRMGTSDKLYVNGHFYSDKPPVPALLLAAWYQLLQSTTGLHAAEAPDRFCYWMTVGSSGVAFVAAVASIFALCARLGLSLRLQALVAASFALSTVAPAYSRHVNQHIVLLAVVAALLLCLQPRAEESPGSSIPTSRLFAIGTLAGLGYTIDLGAGPILVVCALGIVLYRCGTASAAVCFLSAVAPWIALHHAVNYSIGGTWRPLNASPEALAWTGSPFDRSNMTGVWHQSREHVIVYAAGLLFGKRGFLGHNLPLLLAVATASSWRREDDEYPEIVFAGLFCLATWLVYAALSSNYSGVALSIRWFVPLLAPGYFVLAVLLRNRPAYQIDFLVLSGFGAIIGALGWYYGPWAKHILPLYWPLQAAALISWAMCSRIRKRGHR
jgi:hypothetical protein